MKKKNIFQTISFRLHDGKEMTDADFEDNKIILETEDHEIEDGLNECTYSLTIPRCTYHY